MEKKLLAFVGMPGSGKSEASLYLQQKGIPLVRFGDLTEEEIKKATLTVTPENEKMMREKLRNDFGMNVYAVKTKPKIDELLQVHNNVIIDGLYSWEEYTFLKEAFPSLVLIHVFVTPVKRYERLSKRTVRPFTLEEARKRDIAEIEKLNKGGPIAIADYLIENMTDTTDGLHQKIDALLETLTITL